jgi:hypothetical protein
LRKQKTFTLVQNSRAEHMGKTVNVAEEPEKSTENVAYPL